MSLLENGVGHRKTGTDITPGGPFESPGKDSKEGASIYSGRTLLEVGEPSRAVGSGTEVAPEVRLASGEKKSKDDEMTSGQGGFFCERPEPARQGLSSVDYCSSPPGRADDFTENVEEASNS